VAGEFVVGLVDDQQHMVGHASDQLGERRLVHHAAARRVGVQQKTRRVRSPIPAARVSGSLAPPASSPARTARAPRMRAGGRSAGSSAPDDELVARAEADLTEEMDELVAAAAEDDAAERCRCARQGGASGAAKMSG